MNKATPPTNGSTGPTRSQTSPARMVANMLAVMKPEKPQAYNGRPSSSRTATGMAVLTAIASKATSRIKVTMPIVRVR